MTIAEAFSGSEVVGTTEWSVTTDTSGPDVQTTAGMVQFWLDASALALGDKFRFRIYEKTLATSTQRVVFAHTFANAQARPGWFSPTLMLMHGWDATIQKIAGTDRNIDFSVRQITQTAPTDDPVIISFTPISGDAGDTITITGSSFLGTTSVKVGNTVVPFGVDSDTQITTSVPAGMTPGAYTISVIKPSSSATTSATFYVATFSGPVTLTSDYNVTGGQIAEWDPYVTTTVTVDNKNFIVGNGDGAGFAGTIRMRPSSSSIEHKLLFTNASEAGFVGGGLVPLSTDPGLWIMHEGKIDMQGHNRRTWTRATAGLTAGQTSFNVPTGHNWVVGDTLVFVPTASNTYTQYDERTITSVTGETIGISSGLTFAHPSVTLPNAQVMLPEILNTTSNVMLEGQDATHRPHVFIHAHNSAASHTIKNVALKFMGPRKGGQRVLGRWPFHIHHAASFLNGLVVENCTVRDSGSFAFVAHASEEITFRACVAHNNQESPFWWDHDVAGDISQGIHYENCFASKTLTGDVGEGASQGRLSAFYLDRNGLGHSATGCIAVGTAAGIDTSGFFWPEIDTTGAGSDQGKWDFDNNIGHNNGGHGIFSWENTGGENNPDWNNFIAYHNQFNGVTHGAYGFRLQVNDLVCYRNGWTSQTGFRNAELRAFAQVNEENNPGTVIEYHDMILDSGGVSRYCVSNGEIISQGPVRFIDPILKGYTVNPVFVNNQAPSIDAKPARMRHDYIRPRIGDTGRDMEATDLTLGNSRTGDRVRCQRQNNLTAWQYTVLDDDLPLFEVVEIAPFYP